MNHVSASKGCLVTVYTLKKVINTVMANPSSLCVTHRMGHFQWVPHIFFCQVRLYLGTLQSVTVISDTFFGLLSMLVLFEHKRQKMHQQAL